MSALSSRERAFLRDLRRMAEEDISYFEIARTAVGPGSPALLGRSTIDRRTAASPLYVAAEDIATRAGISQGLILAPEHQHLRDQFPTDGSHISASQASDLIGISRAAVHKAIKAGTLDALRIGNVTVVNRKSAQAYRERRESPGQSSDGTVGTMDDLEGREHSEVLGIGQGAQLKAGKLFGSSERVKPRPARATAAGEKPKARGEQRTVE